MSFTPETVRKLARLARIDVSDEEARGLAGDLEGILEHARKLPELSGSGTERSIEDLQGWVREDVPDPAAGGDDAVRGAPSAKDGFFVVPRAVDKHGG